MAVESYNRSSVGKAVQTSVPEEPSRLRRKKEKVKKIKIKKKALPQHNVWECFESPELHSYTRLRSRAFELVGKSIPFRSTQCTTAWIVWVLPLKKKNLERE